MVGQYHSRSSARATASSLSGSTTILGLEPEISPGSSPHSASPPAMTSNNSAGISAARAAARRATPATQVSDQPSDALVVETPRQSFGVPDPLPYSKAG